MKQTSSAGIPAERIQLCVATGEMVRTHAMGFSDGDISTKMGDAESNIRGACYPGTGNTQNAPGIVTMIMNSPVRRKAIHW